jgi:hypothetical protein
MSGALEKAVCFGAPEKAVCFGLSPVGRLSASLILRSGFSDKIRLALMLQAG